MTFLWKPKESSSLCLRSTFYFNGDSYGILTVRINLTLQRPKLHEEWLSFIQIVSLTLECEAEMAFLLPCLTRMKVNTKDFVSFTIFYSAKKIISP